MEHLYAVAKLIENAGLATPGEDLFIETMPADASKAIMLQQAPTGDAIDRGQEGFYNSWFGVVVRDPDTDLAYQRCRQIANLLKVDNQTIDTIFILTMHPRSKPTTYPRGESDLMESGCTMHIAYAELSA